MQQQQFQAAEELRRQKSYREEYRRGAAFEHGVQQGLAQNKATAAVNKRLTLMRRRTDVLESWWSGPVNKYLSATVSLSCTNCGARRHPSSSLYERPSDQGLEWELKPPLQTLRGWRRNVQACLSWPNDRLSAEIAATATRLSSTTVRQTQKWAP